MSKPTMQVEELRSFARKMDELMPRRADLVREAADTILELRDDLQRANDAVRDAEHDESCAWDRVRKAEAENAKLREYTNELLRVVKLGEIDCGACRHFDECYAGDAMDFAPENCRLVIYARELGIEVPK